MAEVIWPGGKSENIKPTPVAEFTPENVRDAHMFSDVDSSHNAQHHTLGKGPNQAAPGNHTHAGGAGDLSTFNFAGSRNSDSWRQQVMDAFEILGAHDFTAI